MGKGIPSPFGFNGFPANENNLPPEVAMKVDVVVKRMMTKVEPDLQEITRILRENGVPGNISFNMVGGEMPNGMEMALSEALGMPVKFARPSANTPSAPIPAPADDLVVGIKKILDSMFGESAEPILGMIYDPHLTAAHEISKILDAARKRDQESMARELESLIIKLRK